MPPKSKSNPEIPNALVLLLEEAPVEIVEELIKNDKACSESEFTYAIVETFCRYIERGIMPPAPFQIYLAKIIRAALANPSDEQVLWKTKDMGLRDYWLSSTTWMLCQDGKTKNNACALVARRWNNYVSKCRIGREVTEKTVMRASARYRWLDCYRHQLPEFVIMFNGDMNSASKSVVGLEFSGSCKIKVPVACYCEVPGPDDYPIDRDKAEALCRSFCIGVEKYGCVTVPGLLPYFARLFRSTMDGLSLPRALGIYKDRSGRPQRGGAREGWPVPSSQDERDLWLASEVLRLIAEIPQHHGRPAIAKACQVAAENRSQQYPEQPVGKDTVRSAWKRWGTRVSFIKVGRSAQQERSVQRQTINDKIAAIAPLCSMLWGHLIRAGDPSGIVEESQLMKISDDMRQFRNFDLDTMLTALQEESLIEFRVDQHGRIVVIHDFIERAASLGIGPIANLSNVYVETAADARYPIYQPARKA